MLLIELFIYLTFATAYVTYILSIHHQRGPFMSDSDLVYWSSGEDTMVWRVHLFDHFRRLFGVYTINTTEHIWHSNPTFAPLWECSYCLSFWVAAIFTVPTLLAFGHPVWLALLIVPAAAAASQRVLP